MNFRRKPFQSTQKTTEDVDNGHSKNADRLTLICTATLSRFSSGPCTRRPTAVQARSHPNTQLPIADTIDFFLGPRKRGVRPHPPNPLGYVVCSEFSASHFSGAWLSPTKCNATQTSFYWTPRNPNLSELNQAWLNVLAPNSARPKSCPAKHCATQTSSH